MPTYIHISALSSRQHSLIQEERRCMSNFRMAKVIIDYCLRFSNTTYGRSLPLKVEIELL